MQQTKVLIAQLGSNGDCLFVTTIARQIKEIDYPGCHLTWMIGSLYRQVLKNNPYLDNIVEIPMKDATVLLEQRNLIESHIKSHTEIGFDKVFITDYRNLNLNNWFGTTRSSLFRNYPHKIKVPVEPLIYLDADEVERVKEFAANHQLITNKYNIIFESAPQSGQSHINTDLALKISKRIVSKFPFVKVVISSRDKIYDENPNIIDGSVITWRENSELTKYCHLLIGCSSGISWLNTSSWSKKICSLQIVNPNYTQKKITASVKTDFLYFGISTKDLIEVTSAKEEMLFDCICDIIQEGFAHARARYDVKFFPNYGGYKFLKDVFHRIFTENNKWSLLKLFIALLPSNISFFVKNKTRLKS